MRWLSPKAAGVRDCGDFPGLITNCRGARREIPESRFVEQVGQGQADEYQFRYGHGLTPDAALLAMVVGRRRNICRLACASYVLEEAIRHN
jgi:hypothetical protein